MGAQPTVPAPGGQYVHHQTWGRGHPRLLAASQLPAAVAVGGQRNGRGPQTYAPNRRLLL